MYQLMTQLVEAEASRALPPIPIPSFSEKVTFKLLERFPLTARSIRMLFHQPQLGVAWGSGERNIVLIDRDTSGYNVVISVRREADTAWQLLVSLTPATSGRITLTINDTIFQAQLNQFGDDTLIPHIPVDLLEDGTDVEMMIEIEVVSPE